LSQGFNPAGYPTKLLASYQIKTDNCLRGTLLHW
jgi:hypothetical protein